MNRFVMAAATIISSISWMASSATAGSSEDVSYCKRVMYGQERLQNYSPRQVAEKRRVCSNVIQAAEMRERASNNYYESRKQIEDVAQKREAWRRSIEGVNPHWNGATSREQETWKSDTRYVNPLYKDDPTGTEKPWTFKKPSEPDTRKVDTWKSDTRYVNPRYKDDKTGTEKPWTFKKPGQPDTRKQETWKSDTRYVNPRYKDDPTGTERPWTFKKPTKPNTGYVKPPVSREIVKPPVSRRDVSKPNTGNQNTWKSDTRYVNPRREDEAPHKVIRWTPKKVTKPVTRKKETWKSDTRYVNPRYKNDTTGRERPWTFKKPAQPARGGNNPRNSQWNGYKEYSERMRSMR